MKTQKVTTEVKNATFVDAVLSNDYGMIKDKLEALGADAIMNNIQDRKSGIIERINKQ